MPKVIIEPQKTPTKTYYLLIVDSSSSMRHLTETTISGVNEQIDAIKQLEKEFPDQKYKMDFIHFDSKVTVAYTDRTASDLQPITNETYKCAGMTALLDAMGKGIQDLNSRIQNEIATGDASAVVVIITDGEENSSSKFNGTKIKSIIEELQATGRWTFTFVGANATLYQKFTIPIKGLGRQKAEEQIGQLIQDYSEEVEWDDTLGTLRINGQKHLPYNKQFWFPEG